MDLILAINLLCVVVLLSVFLPWRACLSVVGVVALLAVPLASHAAYENLAPPAGWSQSTPGKATFDFSKAPANAATIAARTVRTSTALSVRGHMVTMPVAMRFASNASRMAATAAFGHPAVFAALTIGGVGYEAYQWYNDNEIYVQNDLWVKKRTSQGVVCLSDCFMYKNVFSGSQEEPTVERACAFGVGQLLYGKPITELMSFYGGASPACQYRTSQYPTGYWLTITARRVPPFNTAETYYDKLTREQFEEEMAPRPLPDAVPREYPVPIQWPVEQPIINPEPLPVPTPVPAPTPRPQPMRIPTGDPQLVPDTDPPLWRSPAIDVVPSPTPDQPWRVDIQPKEITSPRPDPLPETAPVPVTPDPSSDEKAAPKDELITCGLPSTPACKIDETGTAKSELPTPEDALKPATDAGDKLLRDVVGDDDKRWTWTLLDAPPMASCSPVVMPSVMGYKIPDLDACATVEGIRSFMAWVWAFVGFGICISLVREVV